MQRPVSSRKPDIADVTDVIAGARDPAVVRHGDLGLYRGRVLEAEELAKITDRKTLLGKLQEAVFAMEIPQRGPEKRREIG
ncbi:hypothetical protein SAMN05877838_0034 [Hoeflea halophila]|uniref:Uncharacterized protein n=2 Tax=Hoeflea halophila TaxID=714899 RepID=A0A286HKH7_9HYPH|nr:hypothetical protein SAMN05877838_0034 [Hoeflea halophila]